MKTRYVLILTAIAAAIAAASPFATQAQDPNAPVPGGMLRTMPHGTYQCALPGDAAGKAFEVVEAEQFRIGTASSYRSEGGRGVYIMRGDELTFTRGPRKGETFRRVGTNQLRKLENGVETKLLCTRLGGSG
ncbi:elongation factor P [Erythrobacter sp. JK5]|uniref:elongation factor P n=1 Tax=Erythrobacter sp. JK5 TaxID=2829500 RepID=UPI001BA7C233|nr:elongation factor P [Erythrobacter sp. JK5]QUL38868.1 elongation factor P [Erythrobacter sp. JK5]